MDWKNVGVSLIGSSHISNKMPCQDAWHVCVLPNGILIAAVADGLGSASKSDIGAKAACAYSVACVEQHIMTKRLDKRKKHLFPAVGNDAERVLRDVFAKTRNHLQEIADQESCSTRDLACTLMIVVVTDTHWYTLHIGDGAIVGVVGDTILTMSPPEQGEYVNMVMPLTSSKYVDHLRFYSGTERFDGIALMSDGVQALAISYKTNEAHPGFFLPLMQLMKTHEIPEIAASLEQQFDSRGREVVDDDMTLLVAYRHQA